VTPAEALDQAFCDDRAAVLATVIRYVGDFEVAEEAVQDAFLAAVASWTRDGVPASPRAWLLTAARRRAVDRVRRAPFSGPAHGPADRRPDLWAGRGRKRVGYAGRRWIG
jgi:predicted RNA polymerase sigma factor